MGRKCVCVFKSKGWLKLGSISSGLAQASLVCLMCHYERLAPGAGLQLSHSIISEADSTTHTAHTHCINYRQLKRPGCDVPAPLPMCHMSGVYVCQHVYLFKSTCACPREGSQAHGWLH